MVLKLSWTSGELFLKPCWKGGMSCRLWWWTCTTLKRVMLLYGSMIAKGYTPHNLCMQWLISGVWSRFTFLLSERFKPLLGFKFSCGYLQIINLWQRTIWLKETFSNLFSVSFVMNMNQFPNCFLNALWPRIFGTMWRTFLTSKSNPFRIWLVNGLVEATLILLTASLLEYAGGFG